MKKTTQYTLAISILLLIIIGIPFTVSSQVAINVDNAEPDASAMLDVSSTDKGLLIPRMTTEERDAIQNPSEGLMIFNTEDDCFNYYTGKEWYKDCGRDLETDKTILSPIALNSTNDHDAEDVAFDSQGNIFITGTFRTEVEIGDTTLVSVGTSDDYLVKYDSDQNVLWVKQLNTSTSHITTDSEDNVYIISTFSDTITIGSTTLTPQGSSDVLLAKYNSAGTPQWAIQTDFSNSGSTSGDVVVDEQDAVYLVGNFSGTATFGTSALDDDGASESFLLKCSSDGIWQWAVQTTNNTDRIDANDLAISGDTLYWAGDYRGNITIGTDTYSSSATQGFAAKYDTAGNYASSVSLGSDDYLELYAVAADNSGNFYAGGNLFGDYTFGDTTFTVDNGESFYLAKYNPSNQVEWVTYQNDGDAFVYDIALDNNNDPIAVGDFDGTFVFDTTTVSAGTANGEIFILKHDKNGNFQWVETGTSDDSSSDDGNGVGVDQNNIIYAIGDYFNTISFSDISLTATGGVDALILRLRSEDGAQAIINNSLDNSQDGDTDPSNEIQRLSFDGSNLEISSSNSVDLSDFYQTINILNLNGTTLEISLLNDGESTKTLDLASINTDGQKIDTLRLYGTTLAISLEGDGEIEQTVDLSSLDTDTDNQTIDKLNLNGTTLEISLEDDGEADQTVDLASIDTDTDNQTIDKLSLNGTTLAISLEDDGESDQTVNLASIDTDDQSLSLNGNVLNIDGGTGVDLTSLLVPIGTIQMWTTETAPSGWLLCDGSTFNTSTYPDLNSVLGGNTLPDFRGRFPLGQYSNNDSQNLSGLTRRNIGDQAGAETHTLTINEMPSHSHGVTYSDRSKDGNGNNVSDLGSSGTTKSTNSTGGNQAHNNMPPFYTINFIIKAE
ncbi:MAG: tail fiber protein [Bacteroidota bacterium]